MKSMIGLKRSLLLVVVKGEVYRGIPSFIKRARYEVVGMGGEWFLLLLRYV